MTRFEPSRIYLVSAAVTLGLGAFFGWCAISWMPAIIAAVIFGAGSVILLALAFRPTIEIRETGLWIGKSRLDWQQIRRVDRTGWISPLVAHLTLADGRRIRLIYPGDVESSNRLTRILQQNATQALLDGVPYKDVWGLAESPQSVKQPMPSPRYRLLTEEDEAEVERLYQKLKTAGHLDPEK